MGAVKEGAGGERDLLSAAAALDGAPGPEFDAAAIAASGTEKAAREAGPQESLPAGTLGGETPLEGEGVRGDPDLHR